jgi:hypothetical protein
MSALEKELPTSLRAAALAERIEQGAAELAAFAEKLTETEWRRPLTEDGGDRRPIGVIVHHVASMYAPEVDVAQMVAKGQAVTDITWEVVARINAQHAREQAGVSQTEALAFLRRASIEAAGRVRALTDAELDQAAPFALSYGAPVTAQFVIEDHALRHSWHHLARIRKALGR